MWGYLHLPAKWLGGRKLLGWGAGPYGEGAGCPEPVRINKRGDYLSKASVTTYKWILAICGQKKMGYARLSCFVQTLLVTRG